MYKGGDWGGYNQSDPETEDEKPAFFWKTNDSFLSLKNVMLCPSLLLWTFYDGFYLCIGGWFVCLLKFWALFYQGVLEMKGGKIQRSGQSFLDWKAYGGTQFYSSFN